MPGILSNIGTRELTIIGLILVLLFGGRKIPEFIRGIGQAIGEFKKGTKEE